MFNKCPAGIDPRSLFITCWNTRRTWKSKAECKWFLEVGGVLGTLVSFVFFMSVHFQGLVPTDRPKNKHLYFEGKSEQWLKLDHQVSNPHGKNCIVLGLNSWNPLFVDSSHNSLFPLKQRSVIPSSNPFSAWMISQNSPIPHENLTFQSVCKSFLVESSLLMGNSQCLPVYQFIPFPKMKKTPKNHGFVLDLFRGPYHIGVF